MNKIFLLVALLLVTFNTSLLAFENISFKVKDEGWIIKDSNSLDKTFFQLNTSSKSGYERMPGSGNKAPTIGVVVKGNKGKYPKYDFSTAKELGKHYSELILEIFGKVKKNMIEEPELKKSSVSTFGKYEAFRFDINFYPQVIVTYIFVSEKYLYTVSIMHYEGDNFTETTAYKNFIDSFEIKDSLPNWFTKNIKPWFKGFNNTSSTADLSFVKNMFIIGFILMIVIVRKLFNSNWG